MSSIEDIIFRVVTIIFNISILFHNPVIKDSKTKIRQLKQNLVENMVKGYPIFLTLSGRRPISYKNQSIDLQSKSMDWLLCDIDLRRERVK